MIQINTSLLEQSGDLVEVTRPIIDGVFRRVVLVCTASHNEARIRNNAKGIGSGLAIVEVDERYPVRMLTRSKISRK
jgi:hypothetical protein